METEMYDATPVPPYPHTSWTLAAADDFLFMMERRFDTHFEFADVFGMTRDEAVALSEAAAG